MPLTREQRAAYGPGWAEFSRAIRVVRAGGRCECAGECGARRHPRSAGRCPAVNGAPSPLTGSTVVLTVAHLERDDADLAARDPEVVAAMCQLCHLSYDRAQHVGNARLTRARRVEALEVDAGRGALLTVDDVVGARR